jgi:PTS system nitrogen regulatory IIA component
MLVLPNLSFQDKSPANFTIDPSSVKIQGNFHVNLVIPDLNSNNKFGVLKELAGALSLVTQFPRPRLFSALLQREHVGSTGIGGELAIPNCRLKGLDRCYLVFGRSHAGINFGAIDGLPVRLFFSFCSPIDNPALHVRLLAKLSSPLKNGIFRANLLKAGNSEEIQNLLLSQGFVP